MSNDEHTAFQTPLPNYEKGESSKDDKGKCVNYADT